MAGRFFGRGSVQSRINSSAKFRMLVRCRPSCRTASRNGAATALRSS